MKYLENKNFYKYACVILALTVTFWFISFLEVTLSKAITENILSTLLFKIINDFWAVLVIGILLLPVYLLIFELTKKHALNIIKTICLIIILGQFALVKYSLTTLLNLGADLLGYSFTDITNTVSASESVSITYFIPFIVFPILFFLLIKLVEHKINKKYLTGLGVICIVLFGCIKLISSNTESITQNKLAFLSQDIIKFKKEKNRLKNYTFNRDDYPLLKPFNKKKDVLSPFFNLKEEKPNVVILIVEGLGSEFLGKGTYSGFTPYLDKLISKSLYWENFVSNTGRTFGVLPSILGSLPYGDTGFLELPKTPSHLSLISILKTNGYTTSYFSGDQSSFDKKINFLEYNEIDHVIDESKFEAEYVKTEANSGGFSWGYPDAEIFKKTLASLNDKKEPRLDIIMTVSNHEPFNFPNKQRFELKVDSILKNNKNLKIASEDVLEYKDIYATLNYSDSSIAMFMENYKKRPEYNNTIFVITGDHRLIPINQKDKLCRFHVPLFIYSPLLKKPETFKSVSSHWDVAPSLLSLLINNYRLNPLQETAWMSSGLDTAKHFRNIHKIPLMRYKGSINDYLYKDYLLSDGELYKVNENFGTYKINEGDLTKEITDSLLAFKKMNAYITQYNKIFPDSLNIYITPKVDFSKEQLLAINTLSKDLTLDQTFQVAREKAFNKERNDARLLCDYILSELPNHADARTLKGRTLAWDGEYKNSEIELLNVIKRAPFYDDSYMAILDLYWWSEQDEKSEKLYKQALANNIENAELGLKMAKAYTRMNKKQEAAAIVDSIITKYPNKAEYKTFKASLK